jgi:hypothetical protein
MTKGMCKTFIMDGIGNSTRMGMESHHRCMSRLDAFNQVKGWSGVHPRFFISDE